MMGRWQTLVDKHLLPAQLKASKQILKRLKSHGIALLWGQVRSAKTRPFLHATKDLKTLVITKKGAIDGVASEAKLLGRTNVDVINYHSCQKLNPDDYECVVLDECHLYIANASPKTSSIWVNVKRHTQGKVLVFASGTPTPEGFNGLYHMLKLSNWSPWSRYKRFTLWFFDGYGVKSEIWNGEKLVPSYKKSNEAKIKADINHLVVNLTRKDTGHVHEAKDVLHYIKPHKKQKKLIEKLTEDKVIETKQGDILADTPTKMMQKIHQINSGLAVKCEDDRMYIFKKDSPKVNFIKEHFDPKTTIILAHYRYEQDYLEKIFPHTGSITKLSSGVDLSHFKRMVLFSWGFSASNFEQVRARMMNIKRKWKVDVDILICGDLDKHVYKAVKSKENFTASWYRNNI